jgi:energy-coupling factor transporter ATP-binding protein EcfA2
MNEQKPIIETNDLGFIYPESKFYAIHDINLKVNEGEFIGITGASGAGKTTLSHCLCGAIPHLVQGHMEGSVTIRGNSTRDISLADLVRDIGIVMQEPESQLFSLSVIADVTFGMENLKFSREEISKRAQWALDIVGMSEFKNRPSGSLSGGQKQRVTLAATIALGSKIIILDEPTSELDPIGSQEVFEALKKLRDEGMTIVLFEQKVEVVAPLVDRLLYIRDGTILYDEKPRDFFEKMRDDYFGSEFDIYIPQVTALAFELSRMGYQFEQLPLSENEFMDLYKKLGKKS